MGIEDVLSAREAALRSHIEQARHAEEVAYGAWRATVNTREEFEAQLQALQQPVQKRRAKGLPEEKWRAAVRQLNAFTVGELATELEVPKPTAKRHLDAMVDEGLVRPAGRFGKSPMYEYIKPPDAGESFEAQQRLRVVHDEALPPVRSQEVVGTGSNGDLKALPKEVRDVVKEAMQDGWSFGRVGNNHFMLRKDGMKVRVAGTPRSAGDHASQVRQHLRNAHLDHHRFAHQRVS